MPLKAPVPRVWELSKGVGFEWECVAISPQHLDACLAMAGGRINVGHGAPWRLDDTDVSVVVLNNENGSVARLWALQLLIALPYPLADVTEMFAVTNAEDRHMLNLVGMLRNECAVVMDTLERKVVFVVTTPVHVVQDKDRTGTAKTTFLCCLLGV